MFNSKTKLIFLFIFIFTGFGYFFYTPVQFNVSAQQPTGSIPTVTGTPAGAIVQVLIDQSNEIVKVYAGPSASLYPAVGVILMGQEIPAYGISQDGEWIQIYYPGVPESVAWVYGPYVRYLKLGNLPVIQPPPTPTLASTPTINPTLVEAFIPAVTQTRLPTFTAAPEIIVATFLPEVEVNRVPTGLIILSLGFIGGFGVLISFLRGR
ncbi:MAG: hypothetical protein UZ14_CFX002000682 [Chloroflexi bacterium OLB14]|nr:MAG: hypothetical protein UZ14_CFX002000682 [Chloroflexi bacterium OLB14]